MGTTTKTLHLLSCFSADLPEIGLSEFVRLTGNDKATTHRRLTELRDAGFLQQDPGNKAYRLGPAISRLEIVKEQTFPARKSAMETLVKLQGQIGETVHVSVIQGTDGMSTLAHLDDKTHGNRVHINPGDLLPFHATASGLVALAYSEPGFVDQVLNLHLEAFTGQTETHPGRMRQLLERIRARGTGHSHGGLEADVVGLSAPLFDHSQKCAGAVAVATPTSRLTAELETRIRAALQQAATEITTAWGGLIPADVRQTWMR
ncbi:MAG: IclR family transcriptional regulator [Hyphomicrobiales bacterium]|nr:IclR family transcriptional regulator [Hyphomicrobiales bacterium]MCP4998350.1 IclR family transcriptional regulator [Hyphomicrobiales bacterium]